MVVGEDMMNELKGKVTFNDVAGVEEAKEEVEEIVEFLKEFRDKGYDMYLNRPRNKCLSEAVILKR